MSEIATTIKFEFFPEIWELIKEYMGIAGGINPALPKLLSKHGIPKLRIDIKFLKHNFDGAMTPLIGNTAIEKRKNLLNGLYRHLRTLDTVERARRIRSLIEIRENEKFKTPEDLEHGEIVAFCKTSEYKYYNPDTIFGTVDKITKCQFIIKTYEGTMQNPIHRKIIVKTKNYVRISEMRHGTTMYNKLIVFMNSYNYKYRNLITN